MSCYLKAMIANVKTGDTQVLFFLTNEKGGKPG